MDYPVEPKPKVFRRRASRNNTFSGCMVVYICGLFAVPVSGLIQSQKTHQINWINILAGIIFWIGLSSIFFLILRRNDRTLARIDVNGNKISQFDETGKLAVKDSLNEIASIYSSHKPGSNSYPLLYFHLLFRSGNYLTFTESYENDFTLRKLVKSRAGHDFIRIPWSEFEMWNSESFETRRVKALEILAAKEKGTYFSS